MMKKVEKKGQKSKIRGYAGEQKKKKKKKDMLLMRVPEITK